VPAPRSPQRVKVTGSLFKGVVPDGAVYVGRSAPGLPGSPYRNMFAVKSLAGGYRVWDLRERRWCGELIRTPFEAATVAVLAYDAATGPAGKYRYDPDVLRFDLAGRDLACWCPPTYPDDGFPVPCHGNILLSRANGAR
jgi:hypothetical protein